MCVYKCTKHPTRLVCASCTSMYSFKLDRYRWYTCVPGTAHLNALIELILYPRNKIETHPTLLLNLIIRYTITVLVFSGIKRTRTGTQYPATVQHEAIDRQCLTTVFKFDHVAISFKKHVVQQQ